MDRKFCVLKNGSDLTENFAAKWRDLNVHCTVLCKIRFRCFNTCYMLYFHLCTTAYRVHEFRYMQCTADVELSRKSAFGSTRIQMKPFEVNSFRLSIRCAVLPSLIFHANVTSVCDALKQFDVPRNEFSIIHNLIPAYCFSNLDPQF